MAASVTSARLVISLRGVATAASPLEGEAARTLENGNGGARWTDGQASGMVDRVYQADETLTSGQTVTYDALAAGSLKDVQGRAIDLDELKAFTLVCNTGAIKMVAPASNFLPLFGAAGDFLALSAGQTVALDFGAAGMSLGTSGKFNVVENAGGAATYSIMFAGSN